MAAAQISAVNGNLFAQVPSQFPHTQGHNFTGNWAMQSQQHSPSDGQWNLNGQPHPEFLDYNNRAQWHTPEAILILQLN